MSEITPRHVTDWLPMAESDETSAYRWAMCCWDRLQNAHDAYDAADTELGEAATAYDAARAELDRIRSTQTLA
jgi:hypothetical protein